VGDGLWAKAAHKGWCSLTGPVPAGQRLGTTAVKRCEYPGLGREWAGLGGADVYAATLKGSRQFPGDVVLIGLRRYGSPGRQCTGFYSVGGTRSLRPTVTMTHVAHFGQGMGILSRSRGLAKK